MELLGLNRNYYFRFLQKYVETVSKVCDETQCQMRPIESRDAFIIPIQCIFPIEDSFLISFVVNYHACFIRAWVHCQGKRIHMHIRVLEERDRKGSQI